MTGLTVYLNVVCFKLTTCFSAVGVVEYRAMISCILVTYCMTHAKLKDMLDLKIFRSFLWIRD
jgi:hypothetical protein